MYRYLYNIILLYYIYSIIILLLDDCVGFSDVSGTATSSWSPDWTATWRREGLLRFVPDYEPFTDYEPRRQSTGGRQSCATIPFSSMSWFTLDFTESKPKFLSANSSSTMAEINPTTSLYLLWKYQRIRDRTQCLFIISENIPVSSAAKQWMNKDRKHVRRK